MFTQDLYSSNNFYIFVMSVEKRYSFKRLILKTSVIGPFTREQISFKEKFRIPEALEMTRAAEKMVNYFLKANNKNPDDFNVKIQEVDSLLFDEEYEWFDAVAKGYIQGVEESFPVTINLTQGDTWTVTLGD